MTLKTSLVKTAGFAAILGVAAAQSVPAQPAVKTLPPVFPFIISYDGPANASSMAHLLDAPAGKHGFVRVKDGRFATDAGPIRFFATSLTGPANFPTHEVADKLSARLARFGINCVRLHFMDTWYTNFMPKPVQGILTDDPKTLRDLDPKQVEKLDYMISAFKKRGIYVDMNLHVGRTWDERDGFEEAKGLPWADKGVDIWEPRMIELQKEYARKLLTHVNPYTGNAYTAETCVAMIEISNEDSLLLSNPERLPEIYASELRKQWNAWLHQTYSSAAALEAAWNGSQELQGEPPPRKTESAPAQNGAAPGQEQAKAFADHAIPLGGRGGTLPLVAVRDYRRFLLEIDSRHWRDMHAYLKQDLKVKVPISGTQLAYSPPHIQAQLDYVDRHAYWKHPQGGWVSPTAGAWYIDNIPLVNTLGSIQDLIAVQRVANRPFTLSEYNHPYPIQYGAEGQPTMAAFARLQGWDGIFQYSYNHYVDDFEPQATPYCIFDSIARTDVLAHFPAAAAMFLRGDVQEAHESYNVAVDRAKYMERLLTTRSVEFDLGMLGVDKRISLIHKTGLDYAGGGIKPAEAPRLPKDQRIFVSDTKEILWNTEKPERAYLTVNTPNTKFFTGFPEGRTIDLGDVKLTVGETRLNWATISLVSRQATGFGEAAKAADILLAATGESGNTGQVIKPVPGGSGARITLAERGGAPVWVEGIPAEVTLPSDAARTKCYALDPQGNRMTDVPVEQAGKGSRIVLKPEYRTVWYEIAIQ
jgi:hypothetical protein